MQGDWLSQRVTLLEQQVESLESLFNVFRQEVAAQFDAVGRRFDDLEERIDVRFDAVHRVLISLQTQLADQQSQVAATHSQMRTLHEDVISRIATLGERWNQSRPRPRKKQ